MIVSWIYSHSLSIYVWRLSSTPMGMDLYDYDLCRFSDCDLKW